MPRKKIIEKEPLKEKKEIKPDYIYSVGRRKEAIARVRLYSSVKSDLSWGDLPVRKGDLIVNGIPIEKYFSGEVAKKQYLEPFRLTNTLDKFAVTAKLEGGGLQGQLDALILGVSRALSKFDSEKFRPVLKKKGFLRSDARVRERRKIGTGGKARRRKQSPKR
ncbi:MAG: 30S ribosomal protein S9 [Candidatus Pacearchaeota archaeon]